MHAITNKCIHLLVGLLHIPHGEFRNCIFLIMWGRGGVMVFITRTAWVLSIYEHCSKVLKWVSVMEN